jgi:hypothetical protein
VCVSVRVFVCVCTHTHTHIYNLYIQSTFNTGVAGVSDWDLRLCVPVSHRQLVYVRVRGVGLSWAGE